MATTTLTKNELHKFNAPIERVPAGHVFGPILLPNILGDWRNMDANTRGIVRVVVTETGGKLWVEVYGACEPTPCDWKKVEAHAYDATVTGGPAVAFTASYTFGFKDTLVTGHLAGAHLIVEDFNTFTDNSGRMPYFGSGTFKK